MLDLKSGYCQEEVEEENGQRKMAFIVSDSLYDRQAMPFVLCKGAVTFKLPVYTALGFLSPKHCLVHTDDILAFGRDIQQHNFNLRAVMDRL
ncbi:unnamed protein product [Hydatigera taeniaeformis]|uniref:Reverse transcriptase domain-containing protein n=1 Tax=Hydatigena taeniaeformis TaxID=6205 RepID=A0A0R3XD70_HYDTA|nr:unnamed protein product [Hydatigera taeniaeformis]